MTAFPSLEWMTELKNTLNNDKEFKKASQWFMGSIALEFGDTYQYWLEISRGSILDVQEGENVFGVTFTISGPIDDWKGLITDQEPGLAKLTTETPEFKCGNLAFKGNIVEAIRNFKMLWIMTQDMRNIDTEF